MLNSHQLKEFSMQKMANSMQHISFLGKVSANELSNNFQLMFLIVSRQVHDISRKLFVSQPVSDGDDEVIAAVNTRFFLNYLSRPMGTIHHSFAMVAFFASDFFSFHLFQDRSSKLIQQFFSIPFKIKYDVLLQLQKACGSVQMKS